MLTLATRPQFATLLDALTLQEADERPAVIYMETDREPVTISREEFRAESMVVANSLRELGVRPRDLVVIAHTQSLESIFAFWGALLLGAVPSMFPTLTEKLDPEVYMRGMAELVRLSNVAAVLTTDAFAPSLRSILPCPVYSSAQMKNVPTVAPFSRMATGGNDSGESSYSFARKATVAPLSRTATGGNDSGESPYSFASWREISSDKIAFLQHSSGTTGLQKGVALSHAAVLNQLAAYSDSILLREDDVVVSWLPFYHDMGLIAGFLLPLVQGVPLVLMSPFDWVRHPALLFRAIHEHRGTLCWLPNFAYNHCARRVRRRDMRGLSAASMRLFINCSEPVRHDSHALFLERFADNRVRLEMLGVSYAMAENTFAVTQTPPGKPAQLDIIDDVELVISRYAKPVNGNHSNAQIRVSCGPAIPNTEVRVVDGDGQVAADRVIGEIAIRSDCLLTGYYKRPDLQPFDVEGWYLTGDMGYMVEGEVYVVGRRKDLIINAGKNIYPADIEAVVNEVAGVQAGRAVAFGVADEREGTELVAVVAEVATEDEEERRAIGRAIRNEVAHRTAVTVSYVHLVGPKWLLKTSSGKIARGANREKWLREVKETG